MSYPLCFVDTETTGLDHRRHVAWEIAVIRREPAGTDTEHLWQIRPTRDSLAVAEVEALRISRYHERMAVPEGAEAMQIIPDGTARQLTLPKLADALQATLEDAVLVGSNPAFDAAFLKALLAGVTEAPWHYRPVDVATLAAGHLIGAGRGNEVTVPYSSRALSRAVGVEPPGDDAHTALADARWARDFYDAATRPTTTR
ncbi:3'-5' exonuclease [Streptomyces harbinensis]|uniref:3'-5' exonuclease n=1 Tax=Streptomyces harbinensis TaxID=1176198 RepID=UPI003682509A